MASCLAEPTLIPRSSATYRFALARALIGATLPARSDPRCLNGGAGLVAGAAGAGMPELARGLGVTQGVLVLHLPGFAGDLPRHLAAELAGVLGVLTGRLDVGVRRLL